MGAGADLFGLRKNGTEFAAEISQARAAAARLDAKAIDKVLETVGGVTQEYGRLASSVRDTLGLEVASALLFVDLGVEQLPQTDEEYAQRAHAVIERLHAAYAGSGLPDSAPWMSDLARKAQDRLTMGTVVVETQSTLRDIEQRLDRFFRNPAERGELEATAPMFDQVCGVLSVLGADEPVAALRSGSVALLGAGLLAVTFSRRRNPEMAIKAGTGARLGAISGLFCFAMSATVEAIIVVVFHKGPEVRNAMLQVIQQAATKSNDPQVAAALEYFKSPPGMTVLLLFALVSAFFAAIILGSIGGALAGSFLGRSNR